VINQPEKTNSGREEDTFYPESFHVTRKLVILLMVFCFAFLLSEVMFYNHTWDDAYISYRYSKNFVENHGLVYNQGEYVEGYTSFLWVILLGLIGKTGFDIPLAGKALCILFGLGSLVITYFIVRAFDKRYRMAAILAALLLAFRIDYGIHFQSGMETSFNIFMISLGFYLYLQKHRYSLIITGIIAGLLPLIRPDGILFLSAIVLSELISIKNGSLKKCLKNIFQFLLPAVTIIILHLLWRYSYYGDLLPNTFYAKSSGFYLIKYIRGAYYLLKFFVYGGGFLYFIPAVYFIFKFFKNKHVRTMTIIIFLYFLFNIYASGDWTAYSRFMMPVLPLIVIASSFGIMKLLSLLKANKIVSILVVLTFMTAGFQNGLFLKAMPTEHIFMHRNAIKKWITLCEDFRNLKAEHPDFTIASIPIGAIGYYSEARIIDMLGLTNKHIAKHGKKLMGMPGCERWDIEYVLAQKPHIIYVGVSTVLPDGTRRPRLVEEYASEEIYQQIWNDYENIYIPGLDEYWLRKDLIADFPRIRAGF